MLNIETLMILMVLSNFMIAVFLYVFNTSYKGNKLIFRIYIISKLTQSFSWLFILLRLAIPIFWSVLLGNLLLFIGLALEIHSLTNVTQGYKKKELALLFSAGILSTIVLMSFFSVVYFRYAIHAYVIAAFCLYAGIKLFSLKEGTNMQLFTGIIIFILFIVFFIKGTYHIYTKDSASIMIPNTLRSIAVTIYFLLTCLFPILFLLMRNEHQNKKLEALIKTKQKIFSIISHDLRSPYTAILGYSQLIVNSSNDQQYEMVGKYGKIVNDTAKQSFQLLNNLLELMQLQSGGMRFRPQELLLKDLITDLEVLFKANFEQKNIKFTTEYSNIFKVVADKFMLETILRNLIGNSIKFTQNGGSIHLEVTENDGTKTFRVIDSGVGLSSEKITKLLNKELEASTYGTENEKGTGLGLLFCKDFIEKHGGTLHIKSIPNKNTVFSFDIKDNGYT